MISQPITSRAAVARLADLTRDLIRSNLAALALDTSQKTPSPAPFAMALILVLHLFGLAAFWRYYHQPLWLALPTLAALLILPLIARRKGGALAVETLAPLWFLYLILIARVVAVRVLLANEPYQDEASFADPRLFAFQVEATVAAVLAYTALVQTVRLTRGAVRLRALVGLSLALGVAALVWFGVETIGHRTRGVTATDPYAYAQMAIDLAERGTPLHTFALFPYVVNLNVSWYPIEHIGYRLFDNLTGAVPSVWPVGGSVLLAAAYRLGGEEGLYLATPLAALASLIALAWLAWEYGAGWRTVERAAVAGLAVALLATSWEQVDRSIVPLVDAQAQLFSVLAVLFALKAGRGSRQLVGWAVLAGLSLGVAYFVRHTQLLMVVPITVAVAPLRRRDQFRFLAVTAFAALVVAIPDLWYHHAYLGSWLTPESQELALFSLSSFVPSIRALADRFLAGNEFGYLALFLVYGIYRAARQDRSVKDHGACTVHGGKFAVLAVWIVVLGGFHLLYAAVKIRDLLPEFPAVILLTAYGMVALVRDVRAWAQEQVVRQAFVALVIYSVLLLPAMRDRLTILRPWQAPKVTFGYLTAEQRRSFDQLRTLTPPNAVIGSEMNDGPVDLYAGRATFRPGAWLPEERERFIAMLLREHRPIYLLDDGAETSAARRDLAARYILRRVAVLDVPLFSVVDDTPGALWQITTGEQ